MFYRQKILLSLIEACGGELASTDLEKLLFLFCQTTQQDYYEFFPYKYGAFSFISYIDKTKLMEKGILQKEDRIKLVGTQSYLSQLRPLDRISLLSFVQETRDLRGRRLMRKTYLDFPQFAARSEVANTILTAEEYENMRQQWGLSTERSLFTLGYEGRTIDGYLNLLVKNNICALIDVRKNPFSRKQGFSQSSLNSYTQKIGVHYYHLPELGVPSTLRKNLDQEESYIQLFDHYKNEILPYQQESLQKIRQLLDKHRRIALTCFEADPCFCHRHKITEEFESDKGFTDSIVHI